jgi:DNA-directed RNA polymerase specialized sigma24 family protein
MLTARKFARLDVPANTVERVLCRYYDRLVEWGRVLTRGDQAVAEEIVQDLCLHLTIAQPDLSAVRDLDAYLFICLRNMYTSSLAKVSRERLRVIQVEDYDSVDSAVSTMSSESVDVQNQLLRICTYAVWRKYSSKSASHFILHFLLGYRRSDVARLARLPIAAIYNKVKEFRSELREHLSSVGRVRILSSDAPPEPQFLPTQVNTETLFGEMRSLVFDKEGSGCPPESALLEPYKRSGAAPVSCSELAHLAGCQHCLALVERLLRFADHEGPLDGTGAGEIPVRTHTAGFNTMMRTVRRRREQLLERRPDVLAIAVNGRVVAFHKVESAHNSLSSRIDSTSAVQFVEVFDEFGDRLAYLPLNEDPMLARSQEFSQRVFLSDGRRLRLMIRFDGLGTHVEVEYLDPALVAGAGWEDGAANEPAKWRELPRLGWLHRWRFTQWAVAGLACLLAALAVGAGVYRHLHPSWRDVLARSQSSIEAPSAEDATHQVIRIEEVGKPDGTILIAFVDAWQAGNGRSVRRLYDADHQLLAAGMRESDGTSVERPGDRIAETDAERELLQSEVWRTAFTAAGMRAGARERGEAKRTATGFELTFLEPETSAIQSRTFELDRDYHVERERVRLSTAHGTSELRFVQTSFERVPNRLVPGGVFALPTEKQGYSLHERQEPFYSGAPHLYAGQANLQVEVLYALFGLNADTGQPIEVTAMPDGRVRVQGTIADSKLLSSFRARIKSLAQVDRIVLEVRTVAQASEGMHRPKSVPEEIITAGGEAPAVPLVRAACAKRGLTGESELNAETEFSAAALAHAQSALQQAYALDRLGRILATPDASSLTSDARLQWMEMVKDHSSKVRAELQALGAQLNSLGIATPAVPSSVIDPVTDPVGFARAAGKLRVGAETVNRRVIDLFAGRAANMASDQVQDAIANLLGELPIEEAGRLDSAAARLAKSGQTAGEVGEIRPR